MRLIFSSHIVDNSDADLIVRHFHLFILLSISEIEFIKRGPTLSLIASQYHFKGHKKRDKKEIEIV